METDFGEEDELSQYIYGRRQNTDNSDQHELQEYLHKPRVQFNSKEKKNMLQWWKVNKPSFYFSFSIALAELKQVCLLFSYFIRRTNLFSLILPKWQGII